LTVRRWVEYARKIGHAGKSKDEQVDRRHEDDGDLHEDEDEDVGQVGQGKKHKKKKHHHKKKHHKASKEWFTFVRRAFVGTMDPREIEEIFGAKKPVSVEENMEL
jgi:endopolyphosphatase